MIDDGCRLSFSITGDSYSVTDTISGNAIINVRGNYTASSLDRDTVLQHIQNLQEALMTYKQRRAVFNKIVPLSSNSTLIIRENTHFDWTLGLMAKGAQLADNVYTYNKDFDKDAVLRIINKVYASLLLMNATLNPKRDIVRRIADAGLLVWVYENHSVVVFEKDVLGNCMSNCMIDGIYFKVILVSTSKETGTTTLFTTQLEELLTFPTDDSIRTFYPCDENAFE